MKVRCGFVGNSSSSSFVLRGIKMKETALAKLLNITIDKKTKEIVATDKYRDDDFDFDLEDKEYDTEDTLCDKICI